MNWIVILKATITIMVISSDITDFLNPWSDGMNNETSEYQYIWVNSLQRECTFWMKFVRILWSKSKKSIRQPGRAIHYITQFSPTFASQYDALKVIPLFLEQTQKCQLHFFILKTTWYCLAKSLLSSKSNYTFCTQ